MDLALLFSPFHPLSDPARSEPAEVVGDWSGGSAVVSDASGGSTVAGESSDGGRQKRPHDHVAYSSGIRWRARIDGGRPGAGVEYASQTTRSASRCGQPPVKPVAKLSSSTSSTACPVQFN